MSITIEIDLDENEYRLAVQKGFKKYTGGEDFPDDASLDDVGDFARAIPYLVLDDGNTSIFS